MLYELKVTKEQYLINQILTVTIYYARIKITEPLNYLIMFRFILSIYTILTLSLNTNAQNANLEIYGNILNDSRVNCSIFELKNFKPVLLDQVLLDGNYYYTNLEYNKVYVAMFEGTQVTKFMYVAPIVRKVIQLHVDFQNTEERHCFVKYNPDAQDYDIHVLTDEELQNTDSKLGYEFRIRRD